MSGKLGEWYRIGVNGRLFVMGNAWVVAQGINH